MCGIVGYKGKRGTDVGNLLFNANFNKYRGDDGVGVLYQKGKNLEVERLMFSLEEITKKKLYEDRAKKQISIGSFGISRIDKRKYKTENADFYLRMKTLMDTVSNLIVVHHRKASYGGNNKENLHPMYVENKYYIHNGTAEGIESVKNYLEVFEGVVFKSETDTEVIATLYNKLMKRYKKDKDKVFRDFKIMFPDGWGVLLEIDKLGNITAIKDNTRNLWIFTQDNDGFVFVSEPTKGFKDFDKCILLEEGIMDINSDVKGKDYTEWAMKCLKWWNKAKAVDITEDKCVVCETEKKVLDTYYAIGHPKEQDREKRCLECYILNHNKLSDDDVEFIEVEERRQTYKQFIGGMVAENLSTTG